MSGKLKLINHLVLVAVEEMETLDTSDEEIYDVLDNLDEDLCIVLSRRCAIKRSKVLKSTSWYTNILPSLDEKRFKQMLRVTPDQFQHILSLITEHEGFKGKNSGHQLPIEKQLTITLFRLGSSGTGSSVPKVAALFGVSDGGAVRIITRRVFRAVMELENKYITWPNASERSEIVGGLYHELPNRIGYMDGSDFPLTVTPSLDPTSYYSRKQEYSIKAQVVCDHSLKVRHIIVGYPGSVHDARIFANSEISASPEKYLSNSEWLAGDSAYRLTEHIITPFRKNSTFRSFSERRQFNRYFSKYRVRIENCFGIMKQKFASLKQLRIRIRDKESHQMASVWIILCAILYNIILLTMDSEDFEYTPDPDKHKNTYPMPGNIDAKACEIKRKALFNLIMNNS